MKCLWHRIEADLVPHSLTDEYSKRQGSCDEGVLDDLGGSRRFFVVIPQICLAV